MRYVHKTDQNNNVQFTLFGRMHVTSVVAENFAIVGSSFFRSGGPPNAPPSNITQH